MGIGRHARSDRAVPLGAAFGVVAGLFLCLTDGVARAQGFDFTIGGADIRLQDVQSYRERQFANVIRQQTDFSCGSAALATLLTYHYDRPHTETEVFRAMWDVGEQEKIRERGFSLLDMKRFLNSREIIADGFRIPLTKLEEIGVPAIALINVEGYKHFVVIKGIRGDRILLGDPSTGLIVRTVEEFTASWDGTVFFIRSFLAEGKLGWNRDSDWAAHPTSRPLDGPQVPDLADRVRLETYPLDSAFGVLGVIAR